jgi:hypothetical protein
MTDETNNDIESIEIDADVAMMVMLSRIYDLTLIIAQKANKEDTARMLELHAEGQFYGPPPIWNMPTGE